MARRDEQRGDRRNRNNDEDRDNELVEKLVHINRVAATVKGGRRFSFAAGCWIVLVGLSRNYLEVHYPSDVIAAFAVTLPWALAVIFIHQCYAPTVVGQQKIIQPGPEPASASSVKAD